MLRFRSFVVVFSSLLLTASAWASGKDVDAQERAARSACLAGDYVKGAAILSDLFVATKDSAFIYNQGRCFEQNHRYEDALSRFQEYLRVARKASKAERANAQKHIAECKELLAQQGGAAARPDSGSGSKEDKEKAAKKACLTGDPVAGVAILTDLFIETNDPTHLFNQGRCLEQNRRYEDAIARFREYLVKAKNLRPEDREDTNKHIADCDAYLREKIGDHARPEARKTLEITPARVEEKESATRPPADVTRVATAPSLAAPGRGLRVGGGVLAGLGAAGLVTGLVLNLRANQMSKDLEAGWDPSVESSRTSAQTAGWISYGAGTVCLTGGALLYYLGWRAGAHGDGVALLPAVGPSMAGTVLMGAF